MDRGLRHVSQLGFNYDSRDSVDQLELLQGALIEKCFHALPNVWFVFLSFE